MDTPLTRFAVIGMPRTGSTLLLTGLSQHPAITAFGEVFHAVRSERSGAHAIHRDGQRIFFDEQKDDAIRFLADVVFAGAHPNSRAVGFKVFGDHVRCAGTERLFTRLKIELPGLRFVHITRPNYLDALISRVMAETTRNWVRPVGGGEPQALPRIHIDPERSLRFFAAMQETDRFFERFFAGPSYLKVRYEDLARNFSAQMNQVYDFLGVSKFAVEPVIQKQITQSRAQVVENLEELRAAAKGTPYAHLYDLA